MVEAALAPLHVKGGSPCEYPHRTWQIPANSARQRHSWGRLKIHDVYQPLHQKLQKAPWCMIHKSSFHSQFKGQSSANKELVDPSSSNDGIDNNSGGESLTFFVDFLDPAECCESTPCTGFKNLKKWNETPLGLCKQRWTTISRLKEIPKIRSTNKCSRWDWVW
jgi:hypothetical protein